MAERARSSDCIVRCILSRQRTVVVPSNSLRPDRDPASCCRSSVRNASIPSPFLALIRRLIDAESASRAASTPGPALIRRVDLDSDSGSAAPESVSRSQRVMTLRLVGHRSTASCRNLVSSARSFSDKSTAVHHTTRSDAETCSARSSCARFMIRSSASSQPAVSMSSTSIDPSRKVAVR